MEYCLRTRSYFEWLAKSSIDFILPLRPSIYMPITVRIVLIAAVADNGVIGQGGDMPWRLAADLKHFRSLTMGKPVVMGRKTYLSIGKPLAGRTTIVTSRDKAMAIPGAVVVPNLQYALAVARGDARRRGVGEIVIAGGAEIYAQTMPLADRLEITHVRARPEGDTIFPAIDPGVWCELGRSEPPAPAEGPAFIWVTYGRRA
jgi:dihydrofolate reductase